jgi:hypothetical protein
MPLQESAAPLKTEGAAKPEVSATPADPAEEKPN